MTLSSTLRWCMVVTLFGCGGASLNCPPDATKVDGLCVCPADTTLNDANQCVGQKMVSCAPQGTNVPAYATEVVRMVTVDYADGAWTTPAACDWTCDAMFCRNGDSCEEQFSVLGSEPDYSIWIGTFMANEPNLAHGIGLTLAQALVVDAIGINLNSNLGADCFFNVQLRSSLGVVLASNRGTLPNDFENGWALFPVTPYEISAGTPYFLTVFVEENKGTKKCMGGVGIKKNQGGGFTATADQFSAFNDWSVWEAQATGPGTDESLAYRLYYNEVLDCSP